MSNEERDVILQMLADNKISTQEAASLLDALRESEESGETESWPRWKSEDAEGGQDDRNERARRRLDRDMRRQERDVYRASLRRHSRGSTSGRSLFINVTDGDETRTHVHIPLGMAMAASKFIPRKARAYFEEYGIDLSELIESVLGDVGHAGQIVNIRDGDKRVEVTVIGEDNEITSARTTPPSPVVPPVPAVNPEPPAV
jgi:hypothetical protein